MLQLWYLLVCKLVLRIKQLHTNIYLSTPVFRDKTIACVFSIPICVMARMSKNHRSVSLTRHSRLSTRKQKRRSLDFAVFSRTSTIKTTGVDLRGYAVARRAAERNLARIVAGNGV